MSYIFNKDNVVMAFQTVQINPIRTLFSCLKEMLVSGNIIFKKEGFYMLDMDDTMIILLHLFIDANNLEYYICKKEKIVIGLKLEHFFKCINSFDSKDTLTICIENDDYCNGVVSYLTLIAQGHGKTRIKKIQLSEPGNNECEYPDIIYPKIRTFSSVEFTKIVRHMSDISKTLEIKCVGNEIFFTGKGSMSSEQDHRTPYNVKSNVDGVETHTNDDTDTTTIVQGVFSLKYLGLFVRCKDLCENLELYLDNDAPLVVKYNVFNMGVLKLALNPSSTDLNS
jgi:proliferating cell nuclear antigen|tara:strand:+ start:136 stop:978 length:843 start_codon:yes stop_codon:yes gene_type:complete